jgi:hypothetical protein
MSSGDATLRGKGSGSIGIARLWYLGLTLSSTNWIGRILSRKFEFGSLKCDKLLTEMDGTARKF